VVGESAHPIKDVVTKAVVAAEVRKARRFNMLFALAWLYVNFTTEFLFATYKFVFQPIFLS
jgi:hypothetical protein